jgi:hypothetical protein
MTQKLCRTPAVYTRYQPKRDYGPLKHFLLLNGVALAFAISMAMLLK